MSTTDHLLRAILDEPAEDLHRLVYADRLEEFGDAADQLHGQFIRLQIELARPLPIIEGHITSQEPLRVPDERVHAVTPARVFRLACRPCHVVFHSAGHRPE